MPLVIPTASSYGDSSSTEGGQLRKYVLAQVRREAALEWVAELRSVLDRPELKYKDFRKARPRLKRDKSLFSRIENGVGQASVIVIDPEPVQFDVTLGLLREVAEGDRNQLPNDNVVIDRCASAMVAQTPIAYLPYSLATSVPWALYEPVGSLEDFTPEGIRAQIGPGLRQAQIFAARAHAAFDLQPSDTEPATTHDIFRSPLSRVMLAELLETSRAYDVESPKTLPVLNKAAGEIADFLRSGLPLPISKRTIELVREVDSRAIDEIQAADMAAGWAREMLETSDPRVLGSRFARVWLNGVRLK